MSNFLSSFVTAWEDETPATPDPDESRAPNVNVLLRKARGGSTPAILKQRNSGPRGIEACRSAALGREVEVAMFQLRQSV